MIVLCLIRLYEASHCYKTFFCVQICHRVANWTCHIFITLRPANNDVHIDHAWGGLFSNGVWPRIPIGLASDTVTSRCIVSSVVC
jgi:hypothetical protein